MSEPRLGYTSDGTTSADERTQCHDRIGPRPVSQIKSVKFLLLSDKEVMARQRRVPGCTDWHLVIAGWGQDHYRRRLETMVRELGTTDSVCFAGPQYNEAKRRTYAAVHGVVLPSMSEGFLIAVLEAWGAILPVLMTPECNMPVGFQVGAAHRISIDPASIADGLADFFALDARGRQDMGTCGRKLVEDRFTWNRIAADTGAVYRSLIGGSKLPENVMFE